MLQTIQSIFWQEPSVPQEEKISPRPVPTRRDESFHKQTRKKTHHIASSLGQRGESRASRLSCRVKRKGPSLKSLCINLALFAAFGGLYVTYMWLQLRRVQTH